MKPMFWICGEGNCAPFMTLDELAEGVGQYRCQDILVKDCRPNGRIYKLVVGGDGQAYDRFGSRNHFAIELRLSQPGGC